jgi:mono/diheme cytochrome c family protein
MRTFKVLLGALALLAAAALGFVAFTAATPLPYFDRHPPELHITSTPERIARGKKLSRMLCSECHGDPTTHHLTGRALDDLPKELGEAFSRNITRDPTFGIGSWSDGDLVYLLRTGIARDGRYTPPYMVKLPLASDEDLASIVAYLHSDDPELAAQSVPSVVSRPSLLNKILNRLGVWHPLPFPTQPIPPPSEAELGHYLVATFGCYACHSADLKTIDVFTPEKSKGFMGGGTAMLDANGKTVYTANITFDEATGIGKWSKADFRRAIHEGFRPDNTPLRTPMPHYTELDTHEIDALYDYLASVPKIVKAQRPAEAYVLHTDAPGEKLYNQYTCQACHGSNGIGLCDLRGATQKFPTDEALMAFIKNPSATAPGSKMPAWAGIIAETDYKPLMDYVRFLGRHEK